jgi:hypothetical protein
MDEERIDVIAYAGYRGEESPRSFFIGDKRIEVAKIIEQWIEENMGSKGRRRYFKIRGDDWKTHVLCYDEKDMVWRYQRDIR